MPGLNGTRDDEFGNPTFAFGGMQRKAFMIDGIDNTQRGGPGRLGIFSPEDVQETRVVSGAMDAQYGRTVGGIINMVTRGGTNATHGEGLVLERRPGLISKPSLSQTKPFQQWATYSVNIGGPIKRDKLFYFLSGEYEPEDGAHPVTITAANAAALGLPASQLGNAPFKQRFQSYLGRIDWQLNPKDNFYFRYSLYKTPSQFNTSGGLQTISSSNNFNDHDYTGAAQWSRIVSSRSLNELRFGTLRRIFDRPPVSGVVGPVINISGVATLNSNTSANQHYEEDQYNIIDDYSYTLGKHQLRFGTDVDTIHVLSLDRLTDTYNFSNLTQYLGAVNGTVNPTTGKVYNYNTFTQQFGTNTAEHRTTPINFYAQDHWQASPNLSLNYGVRYEYRLFPTLNQNGALPFSRVLPGDPTNAVTRRNGHVLHRLLIQPVRYIERLRVQDARIRRHRHGLACTAGLQRDIHRTALPHAHCNPILLIALKARRGHYNPICSLRQQRHSVLPVTARLYRARKAGIQLRCLNRRRRYDLPARIVHHAGDAAGNIARLRK